jgi:pimeloyl-ACP methyl ester carboxylesterase
MANTRAKRLTIGKYFALLKKPCFVFFFFGIVLIFATFTLAAQDILFRFIPVNQSIPLEQHYTVRPLDRKQEIGKLIFVFPGTNGKPRNYLRFCDFAAKAGFHVIALAYPNSESARYFCQLSEDTACYGNFRREVIFGTDAMTEYEVKPADCIWVRVKEALQAKHHKDPQGGWGQFIQENQLLWSKILLAGHSQGAGHAAWLAQKVAVSRVLLFAGPNDYHTQLNSPAGWLFDSSVTPASRFFAFLHQYDALVPVEEQIQQVEALGLNRPGFKYSPGKVIPAKTQLILSVLDKDSPNSHISLIIDSHTPLDDNQVPLYAPVWKYMLGINNP